MRRISGCSGEPSKVPMDSNRHAQLYLLDRYKASLTSYRSDDRTLDRQDTIEISPRSRDSCERGLLSET